MSKAIMLSIQSKWVAKILNGEKTIEIRKTKPNVELPIDVYIYCTKSSKDYLYKDFEKGLGWFVSKNQQMKIDFKYAKGLQGYFNGKVIAKFTLNKVEEIRFDDKEVQRKACLTEDELFDYLFVNEPYHEDMKKGYAWHIDNLVIFDKPKELSEFKVYKHIKTLNDLSWLEKGQKLRFGTLNPLVKAPQSWCYVEIPNDN